MASEEFDEQVNEICEIIKGEMRDKDWNNPLAVIAALSHMTGCSLGYVLMFADDGDRRREIIKDVISTIMKSAKVNTCVYVGK